jgi:hypothetical protein
MKSEPKSIADAPPGAWHREVGLCVDCAAWKPKKNQAVAIFGGCARAGTTTTHYGDSTYNHYTTDLQSCSAWEPK